MSYVHDDGVLVKIFVSEDDRYNGEHLYQAIMSQAYDMHLSGATAMRGFEGFGTSGSIHSQQNIRVSEDLPIVVNVVDNRERLGPFISKVKAMLCQAKARGLISVSQAEVIHWPT